MKTEKPLVIVTSALPYANGSIHIGHLVEYIQTDIIVRALKLTGKNAVYCCADDTHGTAIEINAQKEGVTPEEFIAKFFKEHQEDFARFLINFDSYYSTNSPENKYFSDLIFKRLKDRGHIYEKEIEQLFCKKCGRFLPDRYVKGKCPKCSAEDQYGDQCEKCGTTYDAYELIDPYCTICSSKPVVKKSTHFFFRLSAFSDKLKEWLTDNEYIQEEIKNQILNWIKDLKDWCVSRDGPYFGFQIPDTDKYYYVWLDAPIGYISSVCNYLDKDKKKTEKTWNKSEIIHFIGKDIVYFHLLFWPAMLMASDFKLPKTVFVHGFLNVNGEKMSKSRGTFLTAKQALELVNPEHLRFYYAANLSNNVIDINLDFRDYVERINSDLVSNIANFIYRTLSFTKNNFDDILDVKHDVVKEFDEVRRFYEEYNLREAVKKILLISSHGNKYFQENEPWKLISTDREKCHQVVSYCVNLIKDLVIVLKPILPDFAAKIETQLGVEALAFDDIGKPFKGKIQNAEIIYRKIEPITLKMQEDGEYPFSRINLKVAKVVSAEEHPDAKKLYVLKIDLGTEQRQLVAGLRPYLKADEILNKNIVVVTNLEKAKLRGYESQGMLLAAEKDGKVVLLQAPKSKPGEQVAVEGIKPKTETITLKQFSEAKLKVKEHKVWYDGKPLKTKKEDITANIEDGAKIS